MVVLASSKIGRLPVPTPVPMFDLRGAIAEADSAIQQHLSDMHRRGQYILGPQVSAFESEFAEAMGGVDAVGVGTGTAALELCLRDAGIGGPESDVVVPSMTSLFTAQAVLAVGAQLRLADVDASNLLLTAESVDKAWTPSTKAVIAVHIYGQPCVDLAEIAALCDERGAVLIQDACQAHGAVHLGKPLSHFSPYCAYSFYPTKNLGALGDGGAVVTSDPQVASRLRSLRDGGRLGDQICRQPGVNSRLDEMQACYLRAFLPLLSGWNRSRRALASQYRQGLEAVEGIRLLDTTPDSVHHLCVARCSRRDELRAFLMECGVHTGLHYPVPLHEQPGLLPFATWSEVPAHAAAAAHEIVSLPVAPHVTEDNVDDIVAMITDFLQ